MRDHVSHPYKTTVKFMVLYSQYFSLAVMKQQTWRSAKRIFVEKCQIKIYLGTYA
jgi:hypothetical protein